MSDESDHIKILKTIDSLNFNVGKKLLYYIVAGNPTERIKRLKLHQHPNFGCLQLYDKQDVYSLIDKLCFNNLIKFIPLKNYNYMKVISLTSKGKGMINNSSATGKWSINGSIEEISLEDKKRFIAIGSFLDGLDDYQKKAVITDNAHILCIAGAGTGKTTALAKRIELLVKLRGVDPEKILAITFTRKARKEMINRLEKLLPGHKAHVETFNSFCEKILLKHQGEVYTQSNKVLDFSLRIRLVRKILNEMGFSIEKIIKQYYSSRKLATTDMQTLFLGFINDVFMVIDSYKNHDRDIKELKNSINNIDDPTDLETAKFVIRVIDRIIYYKNKFGYRDYSEQITHAIEIFEKNPDLVPEFEHILIDEYQDVNNIQMKLIELLKGKNLFAVGDPRQSVFGWRGSRLFFLLNFKDKYPDAKIIQLRVNYRSNQHIVNLCNSVIKSMKLPNLVAQKENKEASVVLLEHDDEEAESLFVANSILSQKVKRNEIFVLARTNKQLENISRILQSFDIRFIKRIVEHQKPDIDPKDDEITLSTVHAIKGMEAGIVYMIGCNPFNYPCKASDHPILEALKINEDYNKYDEELRLFYVGLSRAKSKLIVNYYHSLTSFLDDNCQNIISFNQLSIDDRAVSRIMYDEGHMAIFSKLKKWRLEKSKELGIAPFRIFSDRTLLDISQTMPLTIEELDDIPSIGNYKLNRFGDEVLRVINS